MHYLLRLQTQINCLLFCLKEDSKQDSITLRVRLNSKLTLSWPYLTGNSDTIYMTCHCGFSSGTCSYLKRFHFYSTKRRFLVVVALQAPCPGVLEAFYVFWWWPGTSLTINHKMRIYVPGSTVDSIHRQSNYLVSTLTTEKRKLCYFPLAHSLFCSNFIFVEKQSEICLSLSLNYN